MIRAVDTEGNDVPPTRDAFAICPECYEDLIVKKSKSGSLYWSHRKGCGNDFLEFYNSDDEVLYRATCRWLND